MRGLVELAISTARVGDQPIPYLSIRLAFLGKVSVRWRILLPPHDARKFLSDLASTVRELGHTRPVGEVLPGEAPDGEVRVYPHYGDEKEVRP